jgi:membrane protein DedA with SNARE-associated domain
MLDALVAQYGYLAIFLGTALEGEAVLLLGAAMAHHGLLSLPLVALSALAGSVLADQAWFVAGRRFGPKVLARSAKLAASAGVAQRFLARYGNLYVLGFRFLVGLRTLSPIVIGVSKYPSARFVALNIAGAVIWVATFAAGGYGLGAALVGLLGRHPHAAEALIAVAVVSALIALVFHVRRRPKQGNAA